MKRILTLIFILFVCLSGKAQEVEISGSRKAVRTSGDVLAFVTPVASLTTVLVLQDWKGLKQGALAGVSTIGMTYALKYLIKKERPDGSDKHSFPSMHTSVSFTGAAFIQRRYGWKWGIPAYAIASYVGWSRTYAKKHDWWDVVAGAALGAGSAYIFTRPFATKHNLSISPVASDKHFGIMPKSTTGGTLWREPLSEPEALTFLPVRLPRSITCLSALLRVINTSAYMLP